MGNKRPQVIAHGVLQSFNDLPCYVLDNGQRVFRKSNLVYALRRKKHGKFGNYLAAKNIVGYLPVRLRPLVDEQHDRVEQGVIEFEYNGQIEKGYNSEDFMDVCTAFIQANINGEELSEAQIEIVKNASEFILATAKIGIIALIDEATGYQYQRGQRELEMKLKYFLTDEAREWEKTFPDELWQEFGRLTNWTGSLKLRPKYWGKYVNQLVYDQLDGDVAKYLRENKPPKYTGQKYFQWLNETYGLKELNQQIYKIIGMAKGCETMKELQEMVANQNLK